MYNQKGAALVVVLSLLTVSLMVGLSSMQSSQIDERLAGNYKAASEAYMVAEISASELLERGEDPNSGEALCSDVADNPGAYDDWLPLTEDLGLENNKVSSYRSCEYAGYGPAFIVRGEAGDAVRFLTFSPGGGGGSNPIKEIVDDFIPDDKELFNYALLIGGALAINGVADIDGSVRVGGAYSKRPNHEVGDLAVNDNNDIISDYGPGGLRPSQEFFSRIEELGGYDEPVDGCSRNSDNSVIYCQGSASFDFSEIKGMSVVANGGVTVTGTSEGQSVFIVANDSVDFNGMGGNTFRGVVWSGGSLVFNGQGGTSYEGSFVSGGSSVFNGGLNIEQLDFEDAAPTAGGDMLWKEM